MNQWYSSLKSIFVALIMSGFFWPDTGLADIGDKPAPKSEVLSPLSVSQPSAKIQNLKSEPSSSLGSGSIFQLFSGLFIVIISIVVIVWVMKRFGRFSFTGQQSVKLLGGISIGAREKLLLVEVGKEQILIGVAPGCINKIHLLTEKIEVQESAESFQTVMSDRIKGMFKKGSNQ